MKLLGGGVISVKTVNPLNVREHHFERATRAQRERSSARMRALMALPPRSWPRGSLQMIPKFLVELIRVHPARAKPLDPHDALPASCKHVVDGICDHLGVDDGNTARVRFTYAQEVGDWGVKFRVHEDDPPAENSGGTAGAGHG